MEPASSSSKPSARREDTKKVWDLSASGMLLPYQSLAHEEGSSASTGFEGFSDFSNTTTSSLLDPSLPSCIILVGKTHRPAVECTNWGDSSYGRHYGVISCEGCKGFFKRTVRRGAAYQCRGVKMCVVDKRLRNRCQCCRFQKCLQMGMKREAIQGRIRARETRYRKRGTFDHSHEGAVDIDSSFASSSHSALHAFHQAASSSNAPDSPIPNNTSLELSLAKLQEADSVLLGPFLTNPKDTKVRVLECGPGKSSQSEMVRQLVKNCEKDLYLAIWYIKGCPLIADMPLGDQVALVKCGWNELHLSAMGARAMFASVKHGLILSSGMCISAAQASLFGLTGLVERKSQELIAKMTELKVNRFELACLRGVILLNPDVKGLSNADHLEACREKLYSGLEEHCHLTHPQDVSRFANLLLRLPSLRSITLKCTGLLLFPQLFPTLPTDSLVSRLVQFPTGDLRNIAAEVHEEELQRKLLLASSNTSHAEEPINMVAPDVDADNTGPSGSGGKSAKLSVPSMTNASRTSEKVGEEREEGDAKPEVSRRSKSAEPASGEGKLVVRCKNQIPGIPVQLTFGGMNEHVKLEFLDAVKVSGEYIPLRTRLEYWDKDNVIGCWVDSNTEVTFMCSSNSAVKTMKMCAGAVDSGLAKIYFQYGPATDDFKGGETKHVEVVFESSTEMVWTPSEGATRIYTGTNSANGPLLDTQRQTRVENIAATKALQKKQKKKTDLSAATSQPASSTGLD